MSTASDDVAATRPPARAGLGPPHARHPRGRGRAGRRVGQGDRRGDRAAAADGLPAGARAARQRLPGAHPRGEALRARLQAARRSASRCTSRSGCRARSAPRCTRCTRRCRWRPTSRSTAGRRSSSSTPPTRPAAPRLRPIDFGFHEAPHAHALGKILLANMEREQVERHLDPEPMPRFGPGTITRPRRAPRPARDRGRPRRGLGVRRVPARGDVRRGRRTRRQRDARRVGRDLRPRRPARDRGRARGVEAALRATASRVSRFYRSGHTA